MASSNGPVPGWYAETRNGDFDIGLDSDTKHSGARSAYLKSLVSHPKEFGNLTNWFDAKEYAGKRIKMTAWVKSEVARGRAQLWLRVDGNWQSAAKNGCFDNMDDRPIKGNNDWTEYNLVCGVPAESTSIVFGLFLNGTGKVWLDNVSFKAVGDDVPLTGMYSNESSDSASKISKAHNLDFDELPTKSDAKIETDKTHSKSAAIQADIHEWELEPKGEFEIGLDTTEKHSGTRSVYIKSSVDKPSDFGQISQAFVPNNYLGKRVKLSGWAKTKIKSGEAQLWILVEGDWENMYRRGCFDNMDDRPIKADTDWTQYNMVVDIPETSNHVRIGAFLNGTGTIWVDDFSLEAVDKSLPLTGAYAELKGCGKKEPVNMSFEEDEKPGK